MKFYNESKKFGFITGDDGVDCHFNLSSFNGKTRPQRGVVVTYLTRKTRRGLTARCLWAASEKEALEKRAKEVGERPNNLADLCKLVGLPAPEDCCVYDGKFRPHAIYFGEDNAQKWARCELSTFGWIKEALFFEMDSKWDSHFQDTVAYLEAGINPETFQEVENKDVLWKQFQWNEPFPQDPGGSSLDGTLTNTQQADLMTGIAQNPSPDLGSND